MYSQRVFVVRSLASHLCAPVFNVTLLLVLLRVRRLWHPACRRARCRLLEHPVDLLECETLGLWDEEVGVDKGA